MKTYQRLAALMPAPTFEDMRKWHIPLKKDLMGCITEDTAHLVFTNWALKIVKFMLQWRLAITNVQLNQRMYIERKFVPREIEQDLALATKCIGWKMQCKKNTVVLSPHTNINKSQRRMFLEYTYQQALKKMLVS